MYCRNCGEEIDDRASICVYCGVAVRNKKKVIRKVNVVGIIGFVISLLSLYFGMYFCIASIAGLVISIVGMALSGKCRLNGFAIAGLVLGIISLIIWAIVWIMVGSVIIGIKGGI